MKYYIQIAKKYFDELEGRHLYPSVLSLPAVLWAVTLTLWLVVIVQAIIHPAWTKSGWMFIALTTTEAVWLAVVMWIDARKVKRFITVTNERFGTSFIKASECRLYVLQASVGHPPADYLSIAKEIRELMEIRNKFRKRSDLQLSEIGRTIYDRESKARLLALVIAACSMVVALSVRSNATLETVFDAFGDPAWLGLVALFVVFALTLFLSMHGFRMLALTILDWLSSWGAKSKKLRHAFFEDWVIAYLIRDLAHFYDPSNFEPQNIAEEEASRASPISESSDCHKEELCRPEDTEVVDGATALRPEPERHEAV